MQSKEILSIQEKVKESITILSRCLFYSRKQQFYYSNQSTLSLLDNISSYLPDLMNFLTYVNTEYPIIEVNDLVAIIQDMNNAMYCHDYIALNDIMEMQLLPVYITIEEYISENIGITINEQLLKDNVTACNKYDPLLLYSLLPAELIQELLENDTLSDEGMNNLVSLIDQCSEKGLCIDTTHCGYPTMVIQNDTNPFYLHTDGNVISEALNLASEWLGQDKLNYNFYGLGLGYAYNEMLIADHNINIQIYETNKDMLLLALVFAPLNRMYDSGRFKLIYDPRGNKLYNTKPAINENDGFYIFYPALFGVRDSHLREQLEQYFVNESSVRTQARLLNGNFRKNSMIDAIGIDRLAPIFKDRNVVIVAAGPSLDVNMQQLKNADKDTIILTAGTVLKKLLNAGVTPDYVLITDANAGVFKQIQGIEDCKVPLLFGSTVYSSVPAHYSGDKYILCQEGFEPSEKLASANNWLLVESGGSVMTTALDLCLKLNVNRIIFIGLDLAYTNSKDHASDTAESRISTPETNIYVDAVDGGMVQTTRNLKIYLEWMEKRLKNRSEKEKSIPVIDATEGGAVKKGMQIMGLKEALSLK